MIPETWGMENFSMLGLASKENTFSKIGSSIITSIQESEFDCNGRINCRYYF